MNWKHMLTLAGVAGALSLTPNGALAQAQGDRPPRRANMDPEQARQRMAERMKEILEIKNDDEWKVIEPRLQKAMEARREVGFGGMGRMMGPPPGRAPGGDNNPAAADQARRRNFGPPPNPDAEALQKALDAKASNEEIKAKMAKLRESRKEREAKVAAAQEELRKVLTLRQEAALVASGMLP